MHLLTMASYALAAASWGAALQMQRRRARVVSEVLRSCGAEKSDNGATWLLRGVWVSYGTGPHTACRCLWPSDEVAFELRLRPKTPVDRWRVRTGPAAAAVVDDPSFDADFVVNGAPVVMVRSLLDDETRETLRWFHPCRLKMSAHELVFSRRGYVGEPDELRKIVEMSVRLASRLTASATELRRPSAPTQAARSRP
jgi:hypothetical protein